jgi:hypothetical protein
MPIPSQQSCICLEDQIEDTVHASEIGLLVALLHMLI